MHIAINAMVNLVLIKDVVANGVGEPPVETYRSTNNMSVVGMVFFHLY